MLGGGARAMRPQLNAPAASAQHARSLAAHCIGMGLSSPAMRLCSETGAEREKKSLGLAEVQVPMQDLPARPRQLGGAGRAQSLAADPNIPPPPPCITRLSLCALPRCPIRLRRPQSSPNTGSRPLAWLAAPDTPRLDCASSRLVAGVWGQVSAPLHLTLPCRVHASLAALAPGPHTPADARAGAEARGGPPLHGIRRCAASTGTPAAWHPPCSAVMTQL